MHEAAPADQPSIQRCAWMALDEALQQFEAAADSSGVRPGLSVVVEERECVICLSEPRDTRFGCGHCVACASCASMLQAQGARAGVCPVCRVPIRRIADRGSHLASAPTFVDPEPIDCS